MAGRHDITHNRELLQALLVLAALVVLAIVARLPAL